MSPEAFGNIKKPRSSTPRSRKGCQTCRRRHIKCDETKPSCLKCVKAGWHCDGYTPKPNKALTTKRLPAPALSIASYSIPFRIPGSQQDRQILHYFCVQGSLDIAGFLSSDFWSRTVLRASHEDPVVRQALVSLSSLHLEYATSEDVLRNEVLRQYVKASRALRKRVDAGDGDVLKTALICCVLFYCFESAMGHSESAMMHLQSGIGMLSHSKRTIERKGEDEDMAAISGTLERLDLQATIFDNARIPAFNLKPTTDLGISKGSIQSGGPFENIETAHSELIKLKNWLFHFLNKNLSLKENRLVPIPSDVQTEKKCLLEHFEVWETKFESLRQQSTWESQEACGAKVVYILWNVSYMLLLSDYPHDETVFGASPNPQAERILNLASSVIQATEESNASAQAAKSPQRNFSSETGIVAPVFILAMKCSDESICRRATELLDRSRRREGLYDSQTMAGITRHFQETRMRRIREREIEVGWGERSLERTFEEELDKATGGMDRIGEFVRGATEAV